MAMPYDTPDAFEADPDLEESIPGEDQEDSDAPPPADEAGPAGDEEDTSPAASEGTDDEEEGPPDDYAGADDSEYTSEESGTEQVRLAPFSFRVDRVEIAVPEGMAGVQETEHGRVFLIHEDAWQQYIQPRLADRTQWIQREREYRRRIAELDPERNPDVIRARALAAELDAILSDRDRAAEFIDNFEREKELLRLRAENRIYRELEAAKNKKPAPDPEFEAREQEELRRQYEPAFRAELQAQTAKLLESDEFRGIPVRPRDVADALMPIVDRIITKDDRGQWVVNVGIIKSYLAPFKAMRQASQKTVVAAGHNARALGRVRAPTGVSAKADRPARKRPRKFKSRQEFEEAFLTGDI